jgi:hypothetical protein
VWRPFSSTGERRRRSKFQKKKTQIGDHALPQQGFGLSTPGGAEQCSTGRFCRWKVKSCFLQQQNPRSVVEVVVSNRWALHSQPMCRSDDERPTGVMMHALHEVRISAKSCASVQAPSGYVVQAFVVSSLWEYSFPVQMIHFSPVNMCPLEGCSLFHRRHADTAQHSTHLHSLSLHLPTASSHITIPRESVCCHL